MKNKKTLLCVLIVALIAVFAFSLTACNKEKKDPAKVGTIIVGTTNTIEKATRDEYNFDVMSAALSQLAPVSQNADGTFSPLLCNYETTDSATWKFTVIDGMKWHDGVAVTAEDILFTLQYADKYDGTFNLTGDDKNDAKFTAATVSADKKSIELTLATANVRELSNWVATRIMPKHIYTNSNGDFIEIVSDANSRIGCGPYKFSAFDKNAGTVTFVANADYPSGAPNADSIIIKNFGNADTMNLALAYGEIDMIYVYSSGVSLDAVKYFAKSDNVTVQAVSAANLPAMLVFNNKVAPFNNEDLRKAVSYGLDYAKFRQLFSSEYGTVSRAGIVSESIVGYVETAELTKDLTKAKEYLAKAGYTDADINSDGYHVKDGSVLSFKLTVRSDKAMHVRYAELIQTNLKDIGIRVDIDSLTAADYNAKTSNKFSGGNPTHQAAIMGYTAFGVNGGAGLATMYINGNHAVQGGAQVFDEAFSTIVSNLSSAATVAEYNSAAKACQEYYAEHVPAIALYWDCNVQAYSSRLTGFTVDSNFFLFNVNSWYQVKVAE